MKKIFLKNNKGISMADITIAIVVLFIFVGIIGQTFYSISESNMKIKGNAIVTYYVVKLTEDIDKMSYDQVTKENLETLLSNSTEYYHVNSNEFPFDIEVNIRNYKDEKELAGISIEHDLIKLVEITARYTINNQEQTYLMNKLKIKENNI